MARRPVTSSLRIRTAVLFAIFAISFPAQDGCAESHAGTPVLAAKAARRCFAATNAVASVEGVAHFGSSVSDGISTTSVVLRPQTDEERTLEGIKDAVTRVRSNLTTAGGPIVQVGTAGSAIVTYAIAAPGKTPEQLTAFIEDTVKRSLEVEHFLKKHSFVDS